MVKKATKRKVVRKKTTKRKWYRPEALTPAYQRLVKTVRERDELKCQYPGCKKKRFGLEVHHILPFSSYVAQRYNPMNCILLCRRHHELVTGKELAYAQLFSQIVMQNVIKQNSKR